MYLANMTLMYWLIQSRVSGLVELLQHISVLFGEKLSIE
jgi:hypothetical protein